ncbi:C39 family peptidase [Treponema vincentii]|uniref:C39 family peptidase n=1 Tax=Treponema vincentii TaxID=69710 RepID=UPI0035F55158
MIKGVKFWNARECYFVQTNNPTEEILRKRSDGVWLVSCGPSAAVTCIAAMGFDVSIKTPGGYAPQSEEVLMDFFNDPRNYSELKAARPETPPDMWHGNEIPQFYPVAVKSVFGVKACFEWTAPFETVIAELQAGKAVQLCLKKPGHYIAAVAYDDVSDEVIFNDPLPGRFKDGNGFNRRLKRADFSNVKPFRIVYEA